MLGLYMDHCVPGPITIGLRQRGVDVITAAEDGAAQLDDDQVLDRATSLARALFSQDRDMLAIAHHREQTGQEFGGLAYAHKLKISIGQAINDLELLAKAFANLTTCGIGSSIFPILDLPVLCPGRNARQTLSLRHSSANLCSA